jgi:hypothetical protein
MPKIYELFAYPVTDESKAAKEARRTMYCSFMNRPCDGGGNRYSSQLKLSSFPNLKKAFKFETEIEVVPAGVCSIRPQPDARPWIVCPRRLMALHRISKGAVNTYQSKSEKKLLNLLEYPAGTRIGVWAEVNLAYREEVNGQTKKFDYAFDYILVPLGRVTQAKAEKLSGLRWSTLRPSLEENGFTIAQRDGETFVEDFPVGAPSIVEIMTSSTSGGNKAKRTTIANAFEDAMMGVAHVAPGINYRQVWARMVSQLIVKSEVALEWGGKTIWIVQDVLVDYICSSTALDIRKFLAERSGEVNMLSLAYGKHANDEQGVIELSVDGFFAGPITSGSEKNPKPSFSDMVRTPIKPPLWRVVRLLIGRKPVNRLIVN